MIKNENYLNAVAAHFDVFDFGNKMNNKQKQQQKQRNHYHRYHQHRQSNWKSVM